MNQGNFEYFKTPPIPPSWPKGLLTFVFLIFLLVLGGVFSLNYFIKNQKEHIDQLKKEMEGLQSVFPIEKQEVIIFEKKIKNLEKLLDNHIYFSQGLSALEKLTHPQVYYNSLSFSSENNSFSIEGTAKNQKVLSEAISGFVNNPEIIKAVVLRNTKIAKDGSALFNCEILLQPQVFKYQSAKTVQ